MTVGLLYDPWPARRTRPPRRYRAMVEFKANPRNEPYMRALFAERYPEGRVGTPEAVPSADRVVLLYPDSIGIGWRGIERRVIKLLPGGSEIRALSGRRRDFALDRRTRRELALRRLLETALLGEAIATAVLLVATLPVLGWDLLRGRR